MADEDDITFGVRAEPDVASGRRAGDVLADAISDGIARAAPDIARAISRAIETQLKRANIGQDAFDGIRTGAQEAAQSARFVADAMGNIGDNATRAGAQFKGVSDRVEDTARRMARLRDDTIAFQDRVQASRKLLASIGADDNLLSVFDRELANSQSRLREFDAQARDILADPVRLAGLEAGLEQSSKVIFRELGILQSGLRNLSKERSDAAQRAARSEDRAAQERLQAARVEGSSRLIAEQGANARILAETRQSGQQQLIADRARARTRIELVRFTFNQIQQLERGIAGVFRATGAIANGAVQTLGRSISAIGNLFRRSNADFNQGLLGALRQRESSINGSFDRQSRSIRSSVNEQSVVLQRFERQASTGVFGALTGRSAAGALLGGGVAIGGGFALFQGLRDGLEVGGDFVQGLAVLQAQLGLTEEQMQKVREQSIALGNDITLPGVSALDAAQAIQIASKQFASLGEAALPAAQAAARGILQLSRAAGVGAEEAARVVGAAVNVFGIEATEATAVADQVTNALKNAAGVGFNEFADAFTQSASVVNLFLGPAQEANQTLAETNAALALLARGGIVGSDAGTSLKQFFLQANRGTADANEKLAEISDRAGVIGSVFFDAAGGARTLNESLSILRRGLDGLSDQERNATLQKLFGSDAARAAAILVSATADEFDRLTQANLELGTAAEIAAAQNVGLRGALDALGSVIETQQIKTYERYQEALGRVVLRFAELLNAFFEGEGVFRVIKAGLNGIAIALGALLVAKAAAEGISFLAIALRTLVTPLGFVVTAVSALGAAFSILRETSPAFRAETDRIASSLSGDLASAASGIGDTLSRVAAVVRTELLPRLADLAQSALTIVEPAAERIAAAFALASDYAGAFVQGLSGEGVTSDGLFGFVERLGVTVRSLGLAVDGFIDTLRGEKIDPIDGRTEERQQAIIVLAEKLGASLRGVAERADDAVRGIANIGGAILDLVNTGDFSPLRDRIVDNFTSFGNFIISEIKPELDLVVGFIGDFLSGGGGIGGRLGNNVRDFLLGPFQTAVRELGFFLGNIASDPRLLEALAQIGALAVLTGVNFIAGVGQGIISNAGGLADTVEKYVGQALSAGLKKAISDPFLIAKLLAAALVAARVLKVWSDFGEQGGKKTAQGLATGLREGFTRSLSGTNNQFISGLFGGLDGLERQAQSAARRAGDAALREQARYGDRLSLLGQQIQVSFNEGVAQVDTRKQFDELEQRFGRAALAGASFRSSMSNIFGDVGRIAQGTAQAIGGNFAAGAETARSAFSSLGTNVGQLLRNAASDAKAAAGSLGQAVGGAIISGVGAALSGQALGNASNGVEAGIGLAGIISSALFAGAAFGGVTPAGVLAASAVGAIGLVTAAWQRNKSAAEEAAAATETYTDALVRNQGIAAASTDLGNQVAEALGNVSTDALQLAAEAGFSAQQFAVEAASGSRTAFDAVAELSAGLGVAQSDVEAFRSNLRSGSSAGVIFALENDEGARFRDALDKAGVDVEVFQDLVRGLLGEQGSLFDAALRFQALEVVNPQVKENAEQAAAGMGKLAAGADRYYDSIRAIDPVQQQVIEQAIENNRLAQLTFDNVNSAIESLNQQRTADIQQQIGDLTSKLDLARSAAQAARDNLTSFLTGGYAGSIGEQVDQLVLSIPNLGRQIDEALTLTPTLQASQLNQALAGFGQQVSAVIQAGIEDGTINAADPASIRAALSPFFRAIDELARRPIEDGGISAETASRLRSDLESKLTGESFDVLTQSIFDADAEVASIQEQLDGFQAQLKIKGVFDLNQINTELSRLGLPTIAAIPAGIQAAFGPSVPTAATAGPAIPGVSSPTVLAQAEARQAAEASARAASSTADLAERILNGQQGNVTLQIDAPITVTNPEPVAAAQEVVLGLSAAGRNILAATGGKKPSSLPSVRVIRN